MDRFKRPVSVPKKLSEINAQRDTNVRIFGTVVSKGEDSIVLDDGSKAKEIYVSSEDLESINVKDKVRVYGRVLPSVDDFEIQAEIIQNMNNLNLAVYSQVKEKYGIIV